MCVCVCVCAHLQEITVGGGGSYQVDTMYWLTFGIKKRQAKTEYYWNLQSVWRLWRQVISCLQKMLVVHQNKGCPTRRRRRGRKKGEAGEWVGPDREALEGLPWKPININYPSSQSDWQSCGVFFEMVASRYYICHHNIRSHQTIVWSSFTCLFVNHIIIRIRIKGDISK